MEAKDAIEILSRERSRHEGVCLPAWREDIYGGNKVLTNLFHAQSATRYNCDLNPLQALFMHCLIQMLMYRDLSLIFQKIIPKHRRSILTVQIALYTSTLNAWVINSWCFRRSVSSFTYVFRAHLSRTNSIFQEEDMTRKNFHALWPFSLWTWGAWTLVYVSIEIISAEWTFEQKGLCSVVFEWEYSSSTESTKRLKGKNKSWCSKLVLICL